MEAEPPNAPNSSIGEWRLHLVNKRATNLINTNDCVRTLLARRPIRIYNSTALHRTTPHNTNSATVELVRFAL